MGMTLPKNREATTPEEGSEAPPSLAKRVMKKRISFGHSNQAPDQSSETGGSSELSDAVTESSAVLSVGELTRRITHLLEVGIGLIRVEGEISNLRRQASGHIYFTLKDEIAQLACVLFSRTAAGYGKAALRDGLQVQLYGQISVYQPRGQYQLMVKSVQSRGEGALQARFEELKRRLSAEGLFDQERKRPLPRFPRRIGVVTSPTGAAIRDFLHVLHRRHPGLRVVINPVRVQGRGAAEEIAAAIAEFSSPSDVLGAVDVGVVTRGGGSLEDLWEFNEEVVARAIAASLVPVVSAVGHEIDFTIADFVADLRAPTPSAAAELLAADGAELMERCRALAARIHRETLAAVERHRAAEYRLSISGMFREPFRRIDESRQTCDRIGEELAGMLDRRMERLSSALSTMAAELASVHPGQQLARVRQKLLTLEDKVGTHAHHRLQLDRGRLERIQAALAALSPEATLARGFSITRNAEGHVITASSQVKPGDQLRTQLVEGEIVSEVGKA
jgi:exodeoxyribonuclease VII large subunit